MDNTKKLMTAAAAALSLCACGKQEVKKPNVVFLLFDDLGYGDLGCYGQEKIETPNIDALASQGLLFTDMYSAAPLSAPSRCCLLTGSHMGHSQIRGNEEHYVPTDSLGWNGVFLNPDAQGQFPLEEGTQTLGTMLQSAGYKTAMVGKWGLGFPKSGSTPNTMGFDYFYGFNCQALAHSYYPVKLWENGVEVETGNDLVVQGCNFPDSLDKYDPANYEKYGGKHYSCDLMYDKMEKFVEENASSPFFLMWTTTVPHSAVQAPMDEVMHYVEKLGDEEPCTDPGMYLPNRYPLATYAAMVTHIDTQVGKLIGKLKELGVWDNTIFIVTSDHETGQIWGDGTFVDEDNNGRFSSKKDTFEGFEKIEKTKKGVVPAVQYLSTGHTNSLVPFWAKGAGADCYKEFVRGNDKKAAKFWKYSGDFIFNSDVYNIMSAASGIK